MGADRANLRGLGADDDMAAVPAFPHLDFALFKNRYRLHVPEQRAITLLVMLLNGADHTELGSQFGEAPASAVLAKPSYMSVHS